jgi:UDP-N-acetylglucosamine--N-acetylmuramyl-(pentapeptide) pyrophosphoryl-undecaprenol N-acetylglucosamine transferase
VSKAILIMAGGTGGHVIPGLAIADEMHGRGWRVHWLGTAHGLENRLVPPKGYEMTCLNFSGLRGKGVLHSVSGIVKLIIAIFGAWWLLGKLKPNVVLGMGGYVTVPGGWAVRLRHLPLVLVNADAALLLSNKALATVARRILFGFAGDDVARFGEKAQVTGNPVRREIAAIPAPEIRYKSRSGPLQILVVGGSLGAQALNQVLPAALALIPHAQRPRVTHQAGTQHADTLSKAYQNHGVEANVVPFIEDMASAYASADLLICRAGAVTVSEISAAGVASILVPLVVSTTSHQRNNAEYMAVNGAAIHLPQTELNAEKLAQMVMSMHRAALLEIAQAARGLAKPQATQTVADALERIAA